MKEEPRLKKNQYCLHCIHIFKCIMPCVKGAIGSKMCVNFEERKEEKNGKTKRT